MWRKFALTTMALASVADGRVEWGHSSTAAPELAPPPAEWQAARAAVHFLVADDYTTVDTRKESVTRTRPDGSTATVSASLTAAERDSLFDVLGDCGFFAAGRVGKGNPPNLVLGGPIHITAVAGGLVHEVLWEPTLPELSSMAPERPRPLDPEEPGLNEFMHRLNTMLERRPAYRQLPRVLLR